MYFLLLRLLHTALLSLLGFSSCLSLPLHIFLIPTLLFSRGMLIGSGVMAITVVIACAVFGSSEIKVQKYLKQS